MSNRIYPKDAGDTRAIATRAKIIFEYFLDTKIWEPREKTGVDKGIDLKIEYIENGESHNSKIECQIKGTENINNYKLKRKNDEYSFPFDKKTINYGLNSSNAFILVFVDNLAEKVFCICIQEYFLYNEPLYSKLDKK